MSRRWRWVAGVVAIVAIAAILFRAFVGTPRFGITVSKETTFITEPLCGDGYVDYEAAMNELASKEVTPENNAAVLLLEAFGPRGIDPPISDRFFGMLGIAPLAREGNYYEPFDEFFDRTTPKEPADWSGREERDRRQAALDQSEEAMTRPWAEEEFPILAKWLAENEKPLEVVVAASKRSKLFIPRLRPRESATLIEAFCPTLQQTRRAAQGLSARAMLRLKAGKIEEARQDLLACHRLGRLAAQAPDMISVLMGRAVEAMAYSGDAAFAYWGNLTPEQAKRYAEDLRSLPPLGRMADTVNFGERLTTLDALTGMARFGVDANEPTAATAHTPVNHAALTFTNWDAALRLLNEYADRWTAAFAKPTHRERKAALDVIVREAEASITERAARGIPGRLFATEDHGTTVARTLALVFVALETPALTGCEQSATRTEIVQQMTLVALALAAYRAEHGGYPEDLARLVPRYLKAIPEDPFVEKPIRYRREGTGYVLYSVGPNGQDDDGRESSVRDAKTGKELEGDDIVIRMPVPKKRAE